MRFPAVFLCGIDGRLFDAKGKLARRATWHFRHASSLVRQHGMQYTIWKTARPPCRDRRITRENLSALHQRPICRPRQRASGSNSIDPYRGKPWAKIPRGIQGRCRRGGEGRQRGDVARPVVEDDGFRARQGDAQARRPRRRERERLAEIEVRDNGKLWPRCCGQLRYHPEWWWYFGGLADKIEGAWCRSTSRRPSPTRRTSRWASWRRSRPGIRRCCSSPGNARRRLPPAAPSSSSRRSSPRPRRWNSRRSRRKPAFPTASSMWSPASARRSAPTLVNHPGVAKITFTGSDTTGARSMRRRRAA